MSLCLVQKVIVLVIWDKLSVALFERVLLFNYVLGHVFWFGACTIRYQIGIRHLLHSLVRRHNLLHHTFIHTRFRLFALDEILRRIMKTSDIFSTRQMLDGTAVFTHGGFAKDLLLLHMHQVLLGQLKLFMCVLWWFHNAIVTGWLLAA